MIYFFDKSQSLIHISEPEMVLESTQEAVLGGLVTHFAVVGYDAEIKDAVYFGVKDVDDDSLFIMYRIDELVINTDTIELTGIHVFFDDLKGVIIEDIRPTDQTAPDTLARILDRTGWSVGSSTATGTASSNFYFVPALEAFWEFLEIWDVEYKLEMTFSNGKVTSKKVNLADRFAPDYGKWYEKGDELLSIIAEESHSEVYTAFIGRGKGEEKTTDDGEATGGYGRKITFEEVIWSKADNHPLDKPWDQKHLEFPEATELYGYPDGSPRVKILEFSEITDPNELIVATYEEGLHHIAPKVQMKSEVAPMERAELGEMVAVIDEKFRYKTRIFKMRRDFLANYNKIFEFGERIVMSSTERINHLAKEQGKQRREFESMMQEAISIIQDWYWGEDGYNYDLPADNAYGLPGGFYSFDRPIDHDPTKVIYVGAGKLLIANSKAPNGEWIWQTAATADGLAGDAIIANSITANKLASDVGRSLDLSSNTSINANVTELVKQYIALPEVAEMFKDEEKKTYIAFANSPDGVEDFVSMGWGKGSNLVMDSNRFVWTEWATRGIEPHSTNVIEKFNLIGSGFLFNIPNEDSQSGTLRGYVPIENFTSKPLEQGENYTFTVYIRNLREYPLRLRLNGIQDSNGNTVDYWLNGYAEERVVLKGERNSNSLQFQVYAHSEGYNVQAVFARMQMEKGSEATLWKPHSSEVQDRHYVGLYQGLDPDDYRGEGENLLFGTEDDDWVAFDPSSTVSTVGRERTKVIRVEKLVSGGTSVAARQSSKNRVANLTSGETYTLSFWVRGNTNLTYTFLMHSQSNQNLRVQYQIPSEDEFSLFQVTFIASASADSSSGSDIMIGAYTSAVGKWLEFKEVKLEKGTVATPWTPAPADILADINDPSNYKWIPLVPSTVTEQFSTIQEALDYMEEIQTQLSTAIQQTSEDISLVASSTGGGNYILNSVGYGGTKYWSATGDVQTWADSWVMEQQARSGFRMGTATLSQEVSLDPTKEYTFILKAQSGGGVNASIKVNDTVLASVVTTESKTINITHQITGERQVKISIETNAYAGTYLMLTDIGIFLGHGVEGWSQAPTEHYSNTVRIDLDGVMIDEGLGETFEIKSTGMLHRYQGETVLHHSRAGTMLRSLVVPPIQFVDRDTHLGITYVGRIV